MIQGWVPADLHWPGDSKVVVASKAPPAGSATSATKRRSPPPPEDDPPISVASSSPTIIPSEDEDVYPEDLPSPTEEVEDNFSAWKLLPEQLQDKRN